MNISLKKFQMVDKILLKGSFKKVILEILLVFVRLVTFFVPKNHFWLVKIILKIVCLFENFKSEATNHSFFFSNTSLALFQENF